MTRIWVCCSIVPPWTLHRWAHSWKQQSEIKEYASDLSIAFCVPYMGKLSRGRVLMNLDFADMSGPKFNICPHFVFLQAQWSHFCFWWQPQQHPIPLATATIHKVRTIKGAMHLDMWGWSTLTNLRSHRYLLQSSLSPQKLISMHLPQSMPLLNNSLFYSLVITGSQWTWAALSGNLRLILHLYKQS